MKKLHDGPIECACSTVEEAVQYLQRVIPSLKTRHITKRAVVQVVGFDNPQAIRNPTDVTVFHILPAYAGAKGGLGGFVQIAIGAVLVVAGILVTPYMPLLGQALIGMGASMILGGLLAAMAPAPDRGDQNNQGGPQGTDPEASKYLGASGNTTSHGTRIPVVYGTFKVYGHYLSFNVDAKDVAVGG